MRKRRAIVIDDNEQILSFFEDYFSLLGYELLTFPEPVLCPLYMENAPECTQQYPCADVMLTDYRLPRMTGADMLKTQLQRGCKLAPENKALLSAHLDQETLRSVAAQGFAFFQKPVPIDRLSFWISQCEQRLDRGTPLADRRRGPREALSRSEWYQFDRDTAGVACEILNMSKEGLCLQTSAPLPTAKLVYVTSSSGELLKAMVCWSRKHRDGTYHTGLKCS